MTLMRVTSCISISRRKVGNCNYVIGAVAIAVDKRNRRLGDMVAGTVVVHELQEQGDSYWYSQPNPDAATPPVEAVAAMTPQEVQLIETLLNRRLDLPYEQRQKTATNIADHIGTRLNVPPADRPSPENFLEELSRRYRDTASFSLRPMILSSN
jgi:hypothetical protein